MGRGSGSGDLGGLLRVDGGDQFDVVDVGETTGDALEHPPLSTPLRADHARRMRALGVSLEDAAAGEDRRSERFAAE